MVGQHRSTQRSKPRPRKDSDEKITELLWAFALNHPRQGRRRAYRAVIEAGYKVNLKRIHRLPKKDRAQGALQEEEKAQLTEEVANRDTSAPLARCHLGHGL